ncbi:MAG: FAD:protein FMN transferase [Bacteroidales bacterium]|nr:FAD:protein FMN transferase [Bacteroidales bacterium]
MMKKWLYFVMLLVVASSCKKQEEHRFSGYIFGTYYTVTYSGKENATLQGEVNAALCAINDEFSVFDSASVVSRLNRGEEISPLPEDLIRVLELSLNTSRQTEGAFDITAGPLIRFWGFSPGEAEQNHDTLRVLDSLRQMVGYQKISIENGHLVKSDPRIQLDFNAIAKGYAVDKVAELLEQRGIQNYVVDIGGEVRTHGEKSSGQAWRVGIQIPTETRDGLVESDYIFEMGGKSIATSGNYRNYKEINGQRVSHIINPSTGYAEASPLLSVSVIAGDCASADAYATAFMVLGIEKSMKVLEHHPELAAHFIYYENGQYQFQQTGNFPAKIQK